VIKSFRHKGLQRFYKSGDARKLKPEHIRRIRNILFALDMAEHPLEMNLPGFDLHQLKGNLKGFWSVTVSGNWRIIFQFEGVDACDVDLIDYH